MTMLRPLPPTPLPMHHETKVTIGLSRRMVDFHREEHEGKCGNCSLPGQAMRKPDEPKSVFQSGWMTECDIPPTRDVEVWEQIRQVCDAVNMALEKARTAGLIGSGLEAQVLLHITDPALKAQLERMNSAANDVDRLRYVFITSAVHIVEAPAASEYQVEFEFGTVAVAQAEGTKCARCWNFCTSVGSIDGHPELCSRCGKVLRFVG